MPLSAIIEKILERAAARGVSKMRLAQEAGIRPETLSRLQHNENADFRTIADLASAVGLRLTLSPFEELPEVTLFSPSAIAGAKNRARQDFDRRLADGLASREQLPGRSGLFASPDAQFEIKPLEGGQRREKRARRKPPRG